MPPLCLSQNRKISSAITGTDPPPDCSHPKSALHPEFVFPAFLIYPMPCHSYALPESRLNGRTYAFLGLRRVQSIQRQVVHAAGALSCQDPTTEPGVGGILSLPAFRGLCGLAPSAFKHGILVRLRADFRLLHHRAPEKTILARGICPVPEATRSTGAVNRPWMGNRPDASIAVAPKPAQLPLGRIGRPIAPAMRRLAVQPLGTVPGFPTPTVLLLCGIRSSHSFAMTESL